VNGIGNAECHKQENSESVDGFAIFGEEVKKTNPIVVIEKKGLCKANKISFN
jgi:hypothetical protein